MDQTLKSHSSVDKSTGGSSDTQISDSQKKPREETKDVSPDSTPISVKEKSNQPLRFQTEGVSDNSPAVPFQEKCSPQEATKISEKSGKISASMSEPIISLNGIQNKRRVTYGNLQIGEVHLPGGQLSESSSSYHHRASSDRGVFQNSYHRQSSDRGVFQNSYGRKMSYMYPHTYPWEGEDLPRPKDYTVLSCLVLVCCNPPLGLAAFALSG